MSNPTGEINKNKKRKRIIRAKRAAGHFFYKMRGQPGPDVERFFLTPGPPNGIIESMNSNYYTRIPDEFLDLPVSPAAFRVAATIASFCKRSGTCTCAVATLARRCLLGESTVRRALRELEEAGMIQSFNRYVESGRYFRQTSNGYRLCWDARAAAKSPPPT